MHDTVIKLIGEVLEELDTQPLSLRALRLPVAVPDS